MGKRSKRKGPAKGHGKPNEGQGHSKKVKINEVDLPDPTPVLDKPEAEPEIEPESDEINPFLCNPVLKVIMSQMTIDDLKRSRGVCTLWDEYSTKELQKLTTQMKLQNFTSSDQIKKFASSLHDSPNKVLFSHEMRSTMKVISTLERRFFQNFKPKSMSIETEEIDTKASLDVLKILQNSSEHIKKFRVSSSPMYSQFDRNIKWPQKLMFPELEELSFVDLCFKDIHFLIDNVTKDKNTPKFKSLKLYNHPVHDPLCDLLTSNGLIEKLQDLEVYYCSRSYMYGYSNIDFVFSQDLLKMAQTGLKLSKFTISITLSDRDLLQEDILGHLEKIKQFLTSQSDTLVELNICLFIDERDGNIRFNMPPLPKLKVLKLGDKDMYNAPLYGYYKKDLPYNPIDLPSIFPNLKEIIIEFRTDFDNLSKIFYGSLDCVEKVRVRHSNRLSYMENYTKSKYHILETLFPRVVQFEVNHLDIYRWNKQYENIPWKNTLKKLTIHPSTLENLKLDAFSNLKGLSRLELINKGAGPSTLGTRRFNFNVDTTFKSLKIQNYLVHEDVLEEIRSRVTLDYIPPKSALTD